MALGLQLVQGRLAHGDELVDGGDGALAAAVGHGIAVIAGVAVVVLVAVAVAVVRGRRQALRDGELPQRGCDAVGDPDDVWPRAGEGRL